MLLDKFLIEDKVCIITGGAGLLGRKHAEAVISGKGVPVLLDISGIALEQAKKELLEKFPKARIETYCTNITLREELDTVRDSLMRSYGHIDILINNAANNPKVENESKNMKKNRFSDFSIDTWDEDIRVGLTGALLCAQVFGSEMEKKKLGVILNVSSDLGIIAPDQRIYKKDGILDEEQIVKPITYSVIKHGLIGMTKYLATYWAKEGIRVNAICPGGVYNGQDSEFVDKLTNLIPMGRMANNDEYMASILYLISDASSYMTGATVIVDGGRTCW